MVNYGATVKNFNEPTKLLEALITAGKIHPQRRPRARLDDVQRDRPLRPERQRVSREGRTPEGEQHDRRPIALIMALGRAMVEEDSGSVYDNPEPVWIDV